ncbi:uncharacterized protein LOC129611490 isoform X2 [Condylostylus longicornis]|uniref:uncharacterized protein LOC129611490 isoform X2 n=1 Tax=Condylostylus longicornis TaxID=2530218 RepID=UPI00244E3CA2|nr:uncharacterized protein LOC129611490 isoform X2 [Condylostylus longicornis]
MWMPQQQENKQQYQQSANMVPVSEVGLNTSNYVQQEWQSQLPVNYANYQQQTRQPQVQTPYQTNAMKPPHMQTQGNWQTQPLQVPTPLPPQYADFVQQPHQPQISNNLFKKQQQESQQLQQSHSQQSHQPQQQPLPLQQSQQQHQQQQQQQQQPQQQHLITSQTSTYFQQQQPMQVPMYSMSSIKTEQNNILSINTDPINSFSNNFAVSSDQQTPGNNNTPKLESFFEKGNKKDGDGVDGWDDWEWNDLNIQKESTESTSKNQTFNSNLLEQSFNQPQDQLQQNQYRNTQQDQPPRSQNQQEQQKIAQSHNICNSNENDDKNQQIQNSQSRPVLRDLINDNWQWGSEDSREHFVKSNDNVDNKNEDAFTIEDSFKTNNNNNFYVPTSNPQPQIVQENSQPLQEKQSAHQLQLLKPNNQSNQQQQKHTSSQNLENVQSPLGNNQVFISQAKPVSQPPKQFASPPGQNPSLFGQMQVPDISKIPPPQMPLEQTMCQEESTAENKMMQLPPPPLMHQSQTASNPFKRTGPAHHGKAGALLQASTKSNNSIQQPSVGTPFFSPPPPEGFQNSTQQNYSSLQNQENQEIISPENSEIINDVNENVEATSDRNRYMQISHLSEDGSEFHHSNPQSQQSGRKNEDQSNENDAFPPPGLSRLVLGQPETENTTLPPPPISSISQNTSSNYIPPDFDRMIPGTELASSSTLNLERQADGQDTIPSPISAFTNVQVQSADIDDEITSDRNLYQVPGKSEHNEHQQSQIFVQTVPPNNVALSMPQHQNERVVTGVENNNSTNQMNNNQRELELDGENLEDEQQFHQQQQLNSGKVFGSNQIDLEMPSLRDEPIEGANTQDFIKKADVNKSNEVESNSTMGINEKVVQSLPSTANDESDEKGERSKIGRRNSRHLDDKRSKRSSENEAHMEYDPVEDKKNDRFFSDGSDNSSDNRNKKRPYRVENAKNTREKYKGGRGERKEKQGSGLSAKNREVGRDYRVPKNERSDDERNDFERNRRRNNEKQRDHHERDRDFKDRKSERNRDRDRDRNHERGHRQRRYDNDSRYETEGSRYYRGGDSDQDYISSNRRDEKDRRYKKRDEKDDRREYGTIENRRRDRRRDRDDRDEYSFEERKDKHRRSKKEKGNRSDYDDDYRKGSSSRNASERERDVRSSGRDKDRYSQMYGGYSNVYGYDPYTYYQQQQQYYEQLRRTNPQAYMEWYNKYFSENGGQLHPDILGAVATSTMTVGSGADGRESVHSGRSSANNEKDRVDNLSLTIGDSASLTQELHRLTPQKFNNEHAIVSLSAGVMVCVKPRYMQKNGSRVVKIFKIGCNDSTRRLFQAFPGPLVRGITHKKTIIEFCEDQIRLGPPSLQKIHSRQNSMSSLNSLSQSNKASFVLMYNLLILLLRQNGVVIGTDIAELLIRNQKEFPYENDVRYTRKSLYKENSNDFHKEESLDDENPNEFSKSEIDTDTDNQENSGDNEDSLIKKVKNLKLNSTKHGKRHVSEDEVTDKFRNYLLYGNINEALEWATDNNLWGHALFLASKVDRRLYANVMMKFANKLPLNDPLQTLYQLMSYKTPASVTSVLDEKWGDWRPHLAMILSNTSQRPDLDRRAITTLGDSLYNRGDHFAAHFCFLMAQVGFGTYNDAAKQHETSYMLNSQNAVRLILLGSPFNKNFREFAYNEAIMMTEIYEYACSLNDDKFSIPEFQPYKYLLATRMLDYGFQMKTLMYMEQVSLHIQLDPSRYEMSFISKICDFSDRLKFYDPTIEKTLDNLDPNDPKFAEIIDQFENQKWLQNLQNILGSYKPDVVAYRHQDSFDGSSTYSNYELNVQNQPPQYDQQSENINDQFRAINQQFYELNSQYNNIPSYSVDSSNNQQQLKQEPAQNLNMVSLNSTIGAEYQQQQIESSQFYDPSKMQQNQENNVVDNNSLQNVQLQYQQQPQQQNAQQLQQIPPQQQEIQHQQQPQINQNINLYGVQDTNQLSIQSQQQNLMNNQNGYDYNAWNQSNEQGNDELKDSISKNIAPVIETVKINPIKKSTAKDIIESVKDKVVTNNFDQRNYDFDQNQKLSCSEILAIKKSIDNKFRNDIGAINSGTNSKLISKVNLTKPSSVQQQPKDRDNKIKKSSLQSTITSKNVMQLKQHGLKESQQLLQKQQHQESQSVPQQFKLQQQSVKEDVARPSISLPNAKANQNSKSYYEDDIGSSSGAPKSSDLNKPDNNKAKDERKSTNVKKDPKLQNKSLNNSSQNSGWFEGIWSKLSLKPKNQMILPDDKNPTIVWDPEKKRWVNTEGDETESESFKPPPKMSDLRTSTMPISSGNTFNTPEQQRLQQPQSQLQQQQQQYPQLQPQQQQQQFQQLQQPQQYSNYDQMQYSPSTSPYQEQQQEQQQIQQPINENLSVNNLSNDNNSVVQQNVNVKANQAGETNKVPNLQSNMFKMQRNRTLKKSYVDVFNPSGAPPPKPAEPILAPVIPIAVPQSGFFIPAPVDVDNDNQSQEGGVPQFYNPNQFGGHQQQ